MARLIPPTMLPCGHFAQGANQDGTPRCTICAETAAIEKARETAEANRATGRDWTGGVDPTGAPADQPATAGAPATTGATELLGAGSPVAGVYDIPDHLYHADPLRAYGTESLSATSGRYLLAPSTPAHYRWKVDHPPARTAAMIFGSAVHALALGTADLAEFEGRSWSSKAGVAFLAEHPDHGSVLPILAHEATAAKAMAHALLTHPVAKLGLTGGTPEQAMFAPHPASIWRRCKVDYLAPAAGGRLILTDIKTTDNAAPSKFGKSVGDYGYHIQASACGWLARRLGLARDTTMIFATVEKNPPYLVAVHEIDTADLRRADALNEAASQMFARCLETGTWPGYAPKVHRVTVPVYTARVEEDTLDDLEGEHE